MIRTASILGALGVAGALAASSLGSAPAHVASAAHPLRLGAFRASFATAICKPHAKKKCAKRVHPALPARTVTRQRTVTQSSTTTQTVTTTQTQTVTTTVTAPQPAPRVGAYAGPTQNLTHIHFVVAGTPGAFTVKELSLDELGVTCELPVDNNAVGHLTLYDVGFVDVLPVDANGHFASSATASWSDGSELTISVAGDIIGGQAGGTMSTTGKISNGDGNFWTCATGQETWWALGGAS